MYQKLSFYIRRAFMICYCRYSRFKNLSPRGESEAGPLVGRYSHRPLTKLSGCIPMAPHGGWKSWATTVAKSRTSNQPFTTLRRNQIPTSTTNVSGTNSTIVTCVNSSPVSSQSIPSVSPPPTTANLNNVLTSDPTTPLVPPEPSKGIPVSIKAYYIARGIDIHRIQGKLYKPYNLARREYQAKSVTITLSEENNQYISVFKYGSIVFFNIPEEQHFQHLESLKAEAGYAGIPEALQHTENYKVIVHDNLDKPSVIKAEHLNIRSLDTNNITIVGTVMAQTVALDYYAVAVDRMLESFMNMNMKIQETGNFNALSTQELHKLVASNNSVITNVLLKMGIFEGTDAAWDNADYYYTWEGLRKDFEIDFRYKDLSLKLDIVKDDARFFLEVLHNQKSTKLEWIIIILIAGEMVIGLLGLGMNHFH